MKRFILAYLPLALWAAAVLAIGTLELGTASLPSGSDKAAHFFMYGLGGALAAWAAHLRGRQPGRGGLVLVALVAAIDELNQSRVPSRQADVWDWVADAAGAVVFYGLARWLLGRHRSG